MGKDMTQGNLVKILIWFTVPLVLSGLLQQIFNWVDAFIVGNVQGELSLAAIGATTSIYNLFVMVITGFTSGLSVLSAQQCGMGEEEKLRKTLSTFVILLGGIFFVIAILGIVFTQPILKLLNTPENIFAIAEEYLKILFIGIPFLAVYNIYTAILRGIGDSKAPFLSVLVASIANVVLDIIFVVILRYGAMGAAAATVISQSVMTIFIVIYTITKYRNLRFRINRELIEKSMLTQGSKFSLPPAIQSGTSSAGNLILQRFMNGFGEQTVAAITTAYRVDTIILLPIVNFGSGIATVVAQNIGANNHERAKKALRIGAIMIAIVSICLSLFVIAIGENLIAMFGLTKESVEIGKNFFHAIARCYLIYGLAMAVRGYLEGVGDMLFSGLAGIASLAVRIVISYGFAKTFGNMIIAYAEAFSWIVLLVIYILRLNFKKKNQIT